MHTFCKSKIGQAQQPPSMEGQTHLTLGNKMSLALWKKKEKKKQTKQSIKIMVIHGRT